VGHKTHDAHAGGGPEGRGGQLGAAGPAVEHAANNSAMMIADSAAWCEHAAAGYVFTDPASGPSRPTADSQS
jgi:hypothetical protein